MSARLATGLLGVVLALAACGRGETRGPESPVPRAEFHGHVAPTARTVHANASAGEELDLADPADFEAARRGFLAERADPIIRDASGRVVWDLDAHGFESGGAPPSVNPSLWRQARLNRIHGLFQVREGIYQVRGYDLANMTLLSGKTGWVVIDALQTRETARAARELVAQALGSRPITGLVYTHSHVDHFGGAAAVLLARPLRALLPHRDALEQIRPSLFVGKAGSGMAGASARGSPSAADSG